MRSSNDEFVRLWIPAQSGLAAYISAMVPDYHTAEDVLQECASVLLEKFSQYDSSRPFLPWAIGVARTEVLSRRRRYQIERLVFDEPALDNIAQSYEQFGTEIDDRVEALRHCARKAQGRSRELLDMRYGENLKPREIAKRIGSNPHATTVALARIRAALRACMGKWLERQEPTASGLVSLTSAFIDQRLSPEEAKSLQTAVAEDLESAKLVTLELVFHRQLYDIFQGERVLRLQDQPKCQQNEWKYESVILPAITDDEEEEVLDELNTEPGVDEATFVPPIQPSADAGATDELTDFLPATSVPATPAHVQGSPRMWLNSLRSWRAAAAVLLAVGTLFAIFALVHHRSAATLVASVDARWEQGEHAKGDGFAIGETSRLISGFAELHFKSGATVIVEGPARFRIRSQSLTELFAGKLAARVTPEGHGFTVQTASARVVDLGTEFGVSVNDDGSTHVDVFEGHVEATPQSAGADAAPGKILAVGDSARVSSTAVIADSVGALPQHYVRSMQTTASELDLADLVAGGDGTTNRRNLAIDLRDGNTGLLPPVGTCAMKQAGAYMPVPTLPAVNGVFIPSDMSQVDSAGHQFFFPATDGITFNHLWAGGNVPWIKESSPPFGPPFIPALDGVNYDSVGHGFLFLHSNKGITFDLAAIRRLHPGCAIGSFHAVAGNISKVPNAKADAWVLVDGQERFSREKFTPDTGAFAIDVPIYGSDRFLTLAVTDGGDGYVCDWIILGDPKLELTGGDAK